MQKTEKINGKINTYFVLGIAKPLAGLAQYYILNFV